MSEERKGPKGRPFGYKHREESKAKNGATHAAKYGLPPKGTPERRLYKKIRDTIGVSAARAELGL